MLARLVAILALALTALSAPLHAETSTQRDIAERTTGLLLDKILIERERRNGAGSDFAAQALDVDNRQLAGLADSPASSPALRRRAALAAARIAAAPTRTAYLQWFPAPARVRDDIAKAAQGKSALIVAARQQGRFQMLAQVLEHLQPNSVYRDTWPDDVRRQQALYTLYLRDVRDRIDPQLEPVGQGCSALSRAAGRCKRFTVYEERGTYAYDLPQAQETARLYFPASFQPRFLDASGTGKSRVGEAQREKQESRDRAEQARRDRQKAWNDGLGIVLEVLLMAAGVVGLVFLTRWLKRLNKPAEKPVSSNYGSATFMGLNPYRSVAETLVGVFLGKQCWPGDAPNAQSYPLFSKPESHTLIVAPTRTGKGTRIIVPTLLRYAWSVVVIDPKGENAAVTGPIRQQDLSQKVYILNPWGVLAADFQKRELAPARFNPLGVIRASDPNAVSIAHSLAETICKRSGDPKNSFWEGNAASILTAVMLWLADEPGEKLTLGRVREIITLPRDLLEKQYFYRMAASSAYEGAIRENIGSFIGMGDRELASILTTLNEATRFMSDPQLKKATAASDFDLSEFAQKPTSLYLVIPPTQMATQATWLRLVLAAVSSTFRHAASRKTRCMMLVDEMPALGHVPDLPTDLATMSGYGLDYTLIVQDLGQLRQHYGESSKTILSNCGWKWFSNIRDYDTAKYISDALGDKTIAISTTSESPTGASVSHGEMGRKLYTPDEIMKEGRDAAFVFGPTGRPWYVRPLDYWHMLDQFEWIPDMKQHYFGATWWWCPNPYLPRSAQAIPRGFDIDTPSPKSQ